MNDTNIPLWIYKKPKTLLRRAGYKNMKRLSKQEAVSLAIKEYTEAKNDFTNQLKSLNILINGR